MNKKHTEARLEDAIEHCLVHDHGYQVGQSQDYDPEKALEPARVIRFIQTTQEKVWASLVAIHGAAAEGLLLEGLVKELNLKTSVER